MNIPLVILAMLESNLINHISKVLDTSITEYKRLTGGDINNVFLLKSESSRWVIKLNNASRYPGMFKKEAQGLETLAQPGIIDIPKTFGAGSYDEYSYLLLEYKKTGKKSKNFWQDFGRQLAQLHRQSSETFGFESDNYIGSLPQPNNAEDNAVDFYINQRLKPQFKRASSNGYTFENVDFFYDKIKEIIPQEAPALIHGDLWGGNFIINEEGQPCLIDPATAYAPREIDIALMHLFGGFDATLFKAYNEEFPLAKGWEDRIKLWQLYHVLVHVNLFGGGYASSAQDIINKYVNS